MLVGELLDRRLRLRRQLVAGWFYGVGGTPDVDVELGFEVWTHGVDGGVYVARLGGRWLELSKGVYRGSLGDWGEFEVWERGRIRLSDAELGCWKWLAVECFAEHVETGRFIGVGLEDISQEVD